MLKKENRLLKEKDFQKVFKGGFYKYNTIFTVKVIKTRNTVPRFGIVVSNKISKKAIVRNKLKRQIREILKLFLPKIIKSYDIVVIPKGKALEISFDTMKEELLSLLRKMNVYEE